MSVRILIGDVRTRLAELPSDSVQCVVTSPPYYGLRDYGVAGQIGLELTPQAYVATMVGVFREVRRVLRPDGTCWVNMGDSYANDGKWGGETGGKQAYLDDASRTRPGREKRRTGLKPKDLVGMPWRLAFGLQEDGWYLRQDIIWSKPNPMPESVRDRCTKAHEYLFLLTKSERYYFDQVAILEDAAPNSVQRLAQDIDNQQGSTRANGGTRADRPMKAVSRQWPGIGGWDTRSGGHSTLAHNGAARVSSHGDTIAAGRAAGNKSHKYTKAYEETGDERYRTAAGLINANDTPCPQRNKRSVWTVPARGFKGAHFATFPPDLIRPCILAGTSEKGACVACGAPLRRQARATYTKSPRHGAASKAAGRAAGGPMVASAGFARWDATRLRKIVRTNGWASSCDCEADIVPCVVLEPFGGAGTTGLVADQLGRDAVLIELNPDYAEMARARIAAEQPLLARVELIA